MKKILLVLLSVLLCATCICIVACNSCKDGNHTWEEEGTVTVAPTCTQEGTKTFKCTKCGETKTEPIAKVAHDVSKVDQVDANCTVQGVKEHYKCNSCGKLFSDQAATTEVSQKDLAIATNGKHSLSPVDAVQPTCAETGTQAHFKCSICNGLFSDSEGKNAVTAQDLVIPATGEHDIESVAKVSPTCGEAGFDAHYECTVCHGYFSDKAGTTPVDADKLVLPATGKHTIADNSLYFVWQKCSVCGQNVRPESLDTYKDEFVYDFDEDKQAEIDARYQQLLDAMDGKEALGNEAFCKLFEDYDDDITYIQSQYQFAKIDFDVDYNNNDKRDIFNEMSEYYNTSVSRYYTLFRQVDDSKYADFFWEYEEFTEEDKQMVFALADSYDLDNQNAADEIADDYDVLMNSLGYSLDNATIKQLKQVYSLYNQFVQANNGIAQKAGYDNYMDYAYANVYERDYKPEDVAQMRQYVKQYIGPILADIADAYMSFTDWSSEDQQLYYTKYVGVSVFSKYTSEVGAQLSLELSQELYDYFGELTNAAKGINFAKTANELFKNGNYFTGDNESAYTWYIYAKDVPIMFFGEEYDTAFTFVHEFGHYFQFVYNDRLSLSMDHDETQSQGDEMLFLAWLKENLPEGLEEGFDLLETEQFLNVLGTIVLSTAVDEFEQLVYTGATEYNGQPITTIAIDDQTKVIDYQELFENILVTYWEDIGDFFYTDYWAKVCVDNPAYYISYAMSALPSIEIYAKANTESFSAARDSYLKLFTFADEAQFVETITYDDGSIDKEIKDGVTYQSILNWAGLSGPFQEDLYKTIQQAFAQ